MGGDAICTTCGRVMRPHGALLRYHPGTLARATNETCMSCYQRRGGQSAQAEAPILVDVRTSLRAETFRAFHMAARAHGVTVGVLLSRMADMSLQKRLPRRRKAAQFADQIRALNAEGWSDNRIAKSLGISQTAISAQRRSMGIESPTPRTGGRRKAAF